MNARERAALADQLMDNPLFHELLGGIERAAIETMIYAKDDAARAIGAMRVQAIRDLRTECEATLRQPAPRAAPA